MSLSLRTNPQTISSTGKVRVLVVDDEPTLRRGIARSLIASGFVVDTAEGGSAAIALLRARPIDVVLLDCEMPEMAGRAVLNHISRQGVDVEVVAMVAAGDDDGRAAALSAGAYEVVAKPLIDALSPQAAILRAAERRTLLRRIKALEVREDPPARIVGPSKQMQELDRRASSAAPSSSPVMILGERGTGKGLLARAIHQRSNRNHGPFVVLNLSAVPPDAVDAELFGNGNPEPGTAPGALALADGGSLVLEEIGDLPPPAQAKLARLLAQGTPAADATVRSVPEDGDVKSFSVRVISTSHVDLRAQVASGHFREDLFYRLSVIPLEIPPLRRRREDIPVLAYHFLARCAARVGKDVRRISVDALRALRDHVWPGNVSELEAAIEQAAVMAQGDAILAGDLRLGVLSEPEDSSDMCGPLALVTGDLAELPYASAKERAVDAFDRAYLDRLMRRSRGNVSEAARLAGMDRSNFRRLLKKVRTRRNGLSQGEASRESETPSD